MNILIINGHPNPESFCSHVADFFTKEAGRVHYADLLNLHALNFDLNLRHGYRNNALEPDLVRAQQLITNADHLVFVYPTWWWTMPALLKGFIDRVFTPGFAFRYVGQSSLPEKLLRNKSATLIVTMDSPAWYYRWFMKSAGNFVMKKGVLDFCGVKTSRVITFDNIRTSSLEKRNKWLQTIATLAFREKL